MDRERYKPSVWNTAPQYPLIDPKAFSGKKPNKVISVPHEYRRQTLVRECDTLIHDIRVDTNCVVIPHWDQDTIKFFDVFGSGPGVEEAVRHLHHWISNARMKSMASSAWAKMSAYNFDKWYYEEVEKLESERKQRFKESVPPANDENAPNHATVVDWPNVLSDQSISPRDVFGNKLERLDALRTQDEVWINPLRSNVSQWQIKIVGYEISDVEVAREHLDTMIAQVCADVSGVQDAHTIILDEREGIEVELQQDEEWWPNHTDRVVPRLLASGMMDVSGSFRQEGLHRTQLSGVRTAIKHALNKVRGRKGVYDFVVRLGCLALNSQKVSDDRIGETFKKDTFMKEIHGSIGLDVKKWLANDDFGYKILLRLMSVNSILEPTKSSAYYGYTPSSLDNTRPIFKGTWVFRDPNSVNDPPRAPPRHAGRPVPLTQQTSTNENTPPPTKGLFVVQIDWTDDEEGKYEKSTPRFYKLDAGKNGPKKNMDINLLELGESRGWHFALESLMPIPTKTVPPVLTGFAARVTMKPKHDIRSSESFADWDATPTIKKYLENARLDSIYCFGLKDTCYKAELTAMWYPRQKRPVWGLAVRHTEWATHLAELERLPIGRQAEWGDTISTFFPDRGQLSSYADDGEDIGLARLSLDSSDEVSSADGLTVLIEKLMKLSEIVSSVTAEGGVKL